MLWPQSMILLYLRARGLRPGPRPSSWGTGATAATLGNLWGFQVGTGRNELSRPLLGPAGYFEQYRVSHVLVNLGWLYFVLGDRQLAQPPSRFCKNLISPTTIGLTVGHYNLGQPNLVQEYMGHLVEMHHYLRKCWRHTSTLSANLVENVFWRLDTFLTFPVSLYFGFWPATFNARLSGADEPILGLPSKVSFAR